MGVLNNMAIAWAARFRSPISDWILAISDQVDAGAAGGSPTGPAGGSLAGTYPNPSIAAGAVGTAEIANGAIINVDVNAAAAIDVTKLAGGTVAGQILTNAAGNIPTWLPPIPSVPQAQIRYVAKDGNDATGNGSPSLPFLTIQAAITSITTASATVPFRISVGPGIYANPFVLQPWMFIEGAGRRSTILNNTAANWIGVGFAAAGAQDTGIASCGIVTTPYVINFADAAILSPGAGRFFQFDLAFDGVGGVCTGNNVANALICQDHVQLNIGATFTWANINSLIDGIFYRSSPLTYTNNAAYALNATRWGTFASLGTLTISCASATNFLNVAGSMIQVAVLTMTGDGATMRSNANDYFINGLDANTGYRFDVLTAGFIPLIAGGNNFISAAITADRTYTITSPTVGGTRLTIFNSSNTSYITLVMTSTGSQSYIPPGGTFSAWFTQSGGQWRITTNRIPQTGTVILVAGVSPFIPCDLPVNSYAYATLKTVAGVFGTPVCGGRVNGTRAGGGGFVITSTLPATGVPVITDGGTYDWQVVVGV